MMQRPSPPVITALPVTIALVLALGILLALPLFGSTYAVKFMSRVLVLAIFVLSLDLLIGFAGLVSFGHAAFFGLGAYGVYFISPEYEAAQLPLALLAGWTLGGASALVIGAFALLTRGFYFIMVTLAAGQMVYALFHDTRIAAGSDGAYINVKPVLTLNGADVLDLSNRVQFYYLCLGILVLSYGLLWGVVRAPFGRVLQGIKANETRMSALGYNSYGYKLAAFTLAGALAGLAGALFAAIDGFVTPELLSWRESGLAIMMVVLGGAGTLYGALLGSFVYAGLEESLKSASMVGSFVAGHWRLGIGATLVAIVLLLPRGLAGLLDLFRAQEPLTPSDIPAPVTEPLPRTARRACSLSTQHLTRRFPGLTAVDDVSITFAPRQIHAIIGPNGAGKTTFTNLISGLLKPSAGQVLIDGLDVTGWPSHRIAQAGIGRSFQRTNILPQFSVFDNCALAAQARHQGAAQVHAIAHALRVAGLTGLTGRGHHMAGQLSNGEQRQLEIAMLIANGADILILDEPLAGMGPEETSRVIALLKELAREHTILLIEHDMDAVFACADTIAVLVQGRLIAHGTGDEIRADARVIEAYLGQGDHAGDEA